MAILPAVKIQEYYEKYQSKELFFNKFLKIIDIASGAQLEHRLFVYT